MSQFAYHFKSKQMTGNFLIPLNELGASHPTIYVNHVKKYQGREHILQNTIPLLNCLWNDVLHISPIHPQIVIDCWRQEGLFEFSGFTGEAEVYKIPVEILINENTVCYQSQNFDFHKYDSELHKFWPFQKESYTEQKTVDARQIEVWQSDMAANRKLMWYSHTMHILTRQKINIENCEIVRCH